MFTVTRAEGSNLTVKHSRPTHNVKLECRCRITTNTHINVVQQFLWKICFRVPFKLKVIIQKTISGTFGISGTQFEFQELGDNSFLFYLQIRFFFVT